MTATELYRDVQARVVALCSDASHEQANTFVPTCPDWTPRDVLAHVVGICADFAEGRTEGTGGNAWTEAQVTARASHDMAQILSEWASYHEFIDELFEAKPDLAWALVADLVTHEFDLRLALAKPGGKAGPAVLASAERYADRLLERVAEADLAPLAVLLDGVRRGPQGAAITLSGSAFEILRAATGRRSLEQVKAMDWTGDPAPYLAIISSYGEASHVDIHE